MMCFSIHKDLVYSLPTSPKVVFNNCESGLWTWAPVLAAPADSVSTTLGRRWILMAVLIASAGVGGFVWDLE